MPAQRELRRNSRSIISLQRFTYTLQFIFISVGSLHFHPVEAGASSTPKNLVTNSLATSETLNLTTTNSNQFQNEYQYRQTASKPTTTSIDRHKLSTSPTSEVSYDHTPTEFTNPSSLDYSYMDSKSMTNVPDCRGRLRLNGTRGFITEGPGYYQTNLQCIWLIDSGSNNATIRIQLHQFNTECNYDFLYLFDGDSVYSPLVAALSGDMKDFSSTFAEARLDDINLLNSSTNTSPVSTSALGTNMTFPASGDISSKNTGILQPTPTESQTFELRTHSGKAFIYFHSDTAQTMPGFYMTYSIDSCPLDCSNRGECDYKTLTCKCNFGFYGEGCQFILCPNNCTSPNYGTCDKEKSCICNKDYTGRDCSKRAYSQTWRRLSDPTKTNPSRAFHQSVIVGDMLWVFGGKSQALSNTNMGIYRHRKTSTILAFDLAKKDWIDQDFEGLTGHDHLAELSGHSVVAHGKKVFIYGGMSMNGSILNTLTVFDTLSRQLSSIPSEKTTSGSEEEFAPPLSVTGHSANMIDGQMYIFMGYNPLYGYLNFVQKFNIANNTWTIVKRRGSSINGYIGHTSTFDPEGRLFYIYGGHNALTSNKLYSFDPYTELWTYLLSGPSYRYYHSAITMNNLLMIIGGNSYNNTHPDQCFQQTHLIYDLSCARSNVGGNDTAGPSASCKLKCWSTQEDTSGILKRHGHSVLTRGDQEIILYGGFNGILMNDLRSLQIYPCSSYKSEEDCNSLKFGVNCNWNIISSACESSSIQVGASNADCSKSDVKLLQAACESRETCSDCLNTNFNCVWCALTSQCQYDKCRSTSSRAITVESQCVRDDIISDLRKTNSTALITDPLSGISTTDIEIDCKSDNCYLCQSRPHCSWQNEVCSQNPASAISSQMTTNPISPAEEWINSQYHKINLHRNLNPETYFRRKSNSLLNSPTYQTCDMPCFTRRSCNECTTTKCIWCSTTDQCIDSSAYFAYHAMGQCMHYVAHMLKCPVASCSDIETCDKCLANPKCGWLNDVSNTGKGRCTEGNSTGPTIGVALTNPLDLNVTETSVATSILPNWFYAGCPACQCNGHSSCRGNSNACILPCQDNTEGPHCDRCIPGYYGDPVNGGTCRQCRCNGHAQSCHRETGKCYCSTKGISGHNCNRCDDKNYYIGDPSSPGNGTCYYNLTTDYQYTFNMSKPEDHFYSDINFINVPFRKDSDVDFSIACSRLALVNITTGASYKTRRPLHTGLECGSFRLRIPFDRHLMTEGNFSFFVHVYKFQTPFILQIAFSQHRTLYLPHFFFTFSCLFLFFFALSGLAWKLKQEYDNYVRRQRQFIEMEQMASRPFSTILLEMFRPSTRKTDEQSNQTKQQAEPTPISFEPCFGSNVGVFSVFVQLPGKPHLAIGSALVSLNEEVVEIHENTNESRKRSSNKEATTN